MSKDISIEITQHAFQRLKERSGLNQSAASKTAYKAYDRGLKHQECTGALHKWVTSTSRTSKKGSMFRIYGDKLWIFNKTAENNKIKLVTVLQVPPNLNKLVNVLMQKKKEVCDV